MTTRHAIIIGIDAYRPAEWVLDSAVADALAFHRWATTRGGVAPANATLLLSPSPGGATPPGGSTPATYQAIQDAVDRFVVGAPVDGDRLYVYFAGHGISAPNVGSGGGPVLVPEDVTDLVRNRQLLYQLDTLIDSLRDRTPVEQFFFVDACRDFALDAGFTAVPPAGAWMPKGDASPSRQYALFATSPGRRSYGSAGVGVFSDALCRALEGEGPALRWDDDAAFELGWDAITRFVVAEVRDRIQRVAGRDWKNYLQEPQQFSRVGSPDVVVQALPIAEIRPRRAVVTVSPKGAREACTLRVVRKLPNLVTEIARRDAPLGLPVTLELTPSTYQVEVAGPGFQPAYRALPLWQRQRQLAIEVVPDTHDKNVRMDAIAPHPTIRIDAGRSGLLVLLWDAAGTLVRAERNSIQAQVEPGAYKVQVVRPDGPPLEEAIEVGPGADRTWTYVAAPLPVSAPVAAMLADHSIAPDASGYLHPSELLGAVSDQTLASILGLAAFAQIWPHDYEMQKLRSFDVHVPSVELAEAAITVIVAAAGEHPGGGLTREAFLGEADIAVLHDDAVFQPSLPHLPLARFPAAVQATTLVSPGVRIVRLDLPGRPVTSYAVAALPGRASVVIAVAHDDGSVELQQYVLPVHPSLVDDLPPYLGPRALVRLERAQRRFGAGRFDDLDLEATDDLLYGKWLDPLFGVIAGFTLARRGELARWKQTGALDNMIRHFGEMPDSHVLAGLADPAQRDAHFAAAAARGIPILSDALRELVAWGEERNEAAALELLVAQRGMIPGSPWTAWVSQRPVLEVTGDVIEAVPAEWDDLARGADQVSTILASVGRLERDQRPCATAFMIAPALAMTMDFAVDALGSVQLSLVFDSERRHPVEIAATWPDRRLALLRVAPAADGALPPSPLALAAAAPPPWSRVYTVTHSHPTGRDAALDRQFADRPGAKTVSPGVVLGIGGDDDVVHDCATAPGSAGGCVVSLTTHAVVGIHWGARAGTVRQGFAKALWTLASDPRVAQLGLRFVSPN